ncbi:MAG: hypothetical protein ACI9GW_002630 [Halieaceae bacterium]|jgi:hypothetical protein
MQVKLLHRALYSLVIVILPAVSMADSDAEIRKFGGLELGWGTFSFEQKIDKKVVFPVANLTAGIAYERFSLALNVSGSMSDADVSEEDFTGTASRRDYDLTAGYQVNSNISIFGGYKDGKTDLDVIGRDEDEPYVGSEFYKQSGPFIGANFGWNFTDAGKLDVSLAYASLDAKNQFFADGDGADEGEEPEFDDITGRNSGDSSGYSFNVSWTMPIGGNLLFRTKFKLNSYDQDINVQGAKFNGIEEESAMLLVGVIGVF